MFIFLDHGKWICNIDLKPYKNIKMSSFKSSENIQKKEGWPLRSVLFSDPEWTGNESHKNTAISNFSKEVIH